MEPLFKQLPILLVDGNYFGHRTIHGLNKGGDFTLDTTLEMMQFEDALFSQLIGLYNSFNNDFQTLISNVCFVFDANSWRKDIEPHHPYYIPVCSDEKIGYKENRVDDEKGINWENWRICLKNFQEKISTFIAVFNSQGAEGDDALLLITEYLKIQKIPSIIFCTDGDLKQLTDDLVIIYRNTKSFNLPDGEIVISKNVAKLLQNQISAMDKLMGRGLLSDSDRDFFTKLFKMQINGGGPNFANRTFENNGIAVPNFKTDAFIKCICGDKKDNIFPIFRWKSGGAGKKNMKVTEKKIIEALEPHGIVLNDDSLAEMLADTEDGKELFLNLLLGLQYNTNQVGISKNVTAHYKHNYRLNILKVEHLPENVINAFNIKLKENLPLLNRIMDLSVLLTNQNINRNDGADILKSSISDKNIILSQEQKTNNNQVSSEIDDILNS